MTWLHMVFVLIFITGPSQGKMGRTAAGGLLTLASLGVICKHKQPFLTHCNTFFHRLQSMEYGPSSLVENLSFISRSWHVLPKSFYVSTSPYFSSPRATMFRNRFFSNLFLYVSTTQLFVSFGISIIPMYQDLIGTYCNKLKTYSVSKIVMTLNILFEYKVNCSSEGCQKNVLITRTIFSHSRSEQFVRQNTNFRLPSYSS